MKKRIVVASTGASGLPILIKCLEILREHPDVMIKEQRTLVLAARETP